MKINRIRQLVTVDPWGIRGPESFATNASNGLTHAGSLVRPWYSLHPFQPPWVPWHPALSQDYTLYLPRRFKAALLVTDAALLKLYLEQAVEDDKMRRVLRRVRVEEDAVIRFSKHQIQEGDHRTRWMRMPERWEDFDRLRSFRKRKHHQEPFTELSAPSHYSERSHGRVSNDEALSSTQVKIAAMSKERKHQLDVQNIQKILASQMAATESLLSKHVSEPLQSLPFEGAQIRSLRRS